MIVVCQTETLIRLDLSSNPGIGPHMHPDLISERQDLLHCGMMELFNNLASSNLKDLEMIDVHIDLVDVRYLCQLFGPRSNLRKFIVGDDTMTSECVAKLVETLLSSSLEELELWFSQWTSESASKFDFLRTNRNLISLEFHKCFIGFDKVISVLAEALQENKTMRKLSMPQSYCIGRGFVDDDYDRGLSNRDFEVVNLSNMLKVNQTLEKVEMSVQNGCLSISIIESVLQRDESRNIQVYINYIGHEWSICSRCATLDQRIQLSPELKKLADSGNTCRKDEIPNRRKDEIPNIIITRHMVEIVTEDD
jgi:hypothetical protein